MDEINQRVWRSPSIVDGFARAEGWTDPGEQAAVEWVAREVRDLPILDIGVGGGRTVPLLRAVSSDYVAIDYTRELVEVCRAKHPDVDVSWGDARDLSRFADESFKLVVFSFNGIDAVDQDDRALILREVHRVLQKGGLFLFSAHNRDGRNFSGPPEPKPRDTMNPLRLGVRLVRRLVHEAHASYNRTRYAKLNQEEEDFSILNDVAHDYGIVVYYTSLAAQLRKLEEAGFEPGAVAFENATGKQVTDRDDTSNVWWFHFVARKPG